MRADERIPRTHPRSSSAIGSEASGRQREPPRPTSALIFIVFVIDPIRSLQSPGRPTTSETREYLRISAPPCGNPRPPERRNRPDDAARAWYRRKMIADDRAGPVIVLADGADVLLVTDDEAL
jgi:hypothetical protein